MLPMLVDGAIVVLEPVCKFLLKLKRMFEYEYQDKKPVKARITYHGGQDDQLPSRPQLPQIESD